MKKIGHADAAEDKKMFSKMLKKAMSPKKVETHLKKDIKEQKKGIKDDKKLMKSMHRGKRGY
jgi:hypothetical protein